MKLREFMEVLSQFDGETEVVFEVSANQVKEDAIRLDIYDVRRDTTVGAVKLKTVIVLGS